MKRILIVKMWAFGDILMATPILRALKRRWPDCEITWLVEKDYVGALRGNPLLDDVIAFDSKTWRKRWRYGQIGAYLQMSLALRRDLKARKFDAVLTLTGEKWWAIWFNAAPVRVGLFPRPRLNGMQRFYTIAIARPRGDERHNTQHYLRAAEALGIAGPFDERMVVGVDAADARDVDAWLQTQPDFDPRRPPIVLHPGASQASKCWPTANFARVAQTLARTANVVVTGSPDEKPLADAIAGKTKNVFVAAGALPRLGHATALIARVAAVVTGDTSVLHIASALDTPFVAVYGSTRPGGDAPLFGRQRLLFDDAVPCAPCYKAHCPLTGDDHLRCQRAVSPAQVLAALDQLLSVPCTLPGLNPRPKVTNPREARG